MRCYNAAMRTLPAVLLLVFGMASVLLGLVSFAAGPALGAVFVVLGILEIAGGVYCLRTP